ncbi:MAG: hypothetical protein JWO91_2608 [Acidobacteriaceae bacterium]|nr:hypothetical protein [Acidobacteriaceae bacterium]
MGMDFVLRRCTLATSMFRAQTRTPYQIIAKTYGSEQ